MKKILSHFTLPLLLLLSNPSGNSAAQSLMMHPEGATGTFERMIIGSGNVAMNLDLGRLDGIRSSTTELKRGAVRFKVAPNSFFMIRVFNKVLRGAEPGSMALLAGNSGILPATLNFSANQLVIEKVASSEPFELVVRDGKTGFVYFNIEGHLYDYDAATRLL